MFKLHLPTHLHTDSTWHYKALRTLPELQMFLPVKLSSSITVFFPGKESLLQHPIPSPSIKKTSAIAFNVMIIHAIAIESIAFHVLFHTFSPTLSIVMLLLNIYTILFLLGEIQAVRLEPFILTEDALCLQLGLKKRLFASYSEIQSVSYYEKEAHGNDKNVFDGILEDFVKEDPAIVIEFIKPVKVRKMYGFTDKAASAHIRPDNPDEFYNGLKTKLLKE
ncbi:hypothetical protein [Metabacillus sp. 84]|uniref:hypothetical protein n=1 Tax=Metabacillus sp. 84 TaxID=3404705 RepID=UPI003CF6F8A8